MDLSEGKYDRKYHVVAGYTQHHPTMTDNANGNGTSTRTLYGLSQSPWTERARWALDHHSLAFTYHEHVPMIGELLLRRKARVKKATVPLLAEHATNKADATIVMGSLEIAKHSEKDGRGTPLFPRDKEDEVARWADVAEQMTRAARAWVLIRLNKSPAALRESLPSFVPGVMRGIMAPSSGMAIRFLMKKYGVTSDGEAAVDQTMRPLLEETRKTLAANKSTYLTGDFSYADIAMASVMHALRPRESLPNVGPATRAAWTNDVLARDFKDLLEWRDTIYAKHR